jgi:hypothetical protein
MPTPILTSPCRRYGHQLRFFLRGVKRRDQREQPVEEHVDAHHGQQDDQGRPGVAQDEQGQHDAQQSSQSQCPPGAAKETVNRAPHEIPLLRAVVHNGSSLFLSHDVTLLSPPT